MKLLILRMIRFLGYDIIKYPRFINNLSFVETETCPPDERKICQDQKYFDDSLLRKQEDECNHAQSNPFKLHLHHIGGRGGGFPVEIPSKFKSSIETYIYDADNDCLSSMQDASMNVDHVISSVMTEENSTYSFNVNYDPFTSSLLDPNPLNEDMFYEDFKSDYILKDVLRPISTKLIQGEKIDDLILKRKFELDFLSLDTQGSEYNLLSSLNMDIQKNLICIICEVSFFKFYNEQKLFDDIMKLLRDKGFFMARFYPHGFDWHGIRAGIGWRGTGYTAHGDVLFFREINDICKFSLNPSLQLYKAAFISICYGNITYALQSLTEANNLNSIKKFDDDFSELGYIHFLEEIFRLYQSEVQFYLPRFTHHYTEEESLSRFSTNNHIELPNKEEIRRRYFMDNDKSVFFERAPKLLNSKFSDLETLLNKAGFVKLSEEIRDNRLKSIKNLMDVLGLEIDSCKIRIKITDD